MASNTFGTLFRVTTFGESHGVALGCVVDGCPAGVPLQVSDVRKELTRREGKETRDTTIAEAKKMEILSGVFEGKTLGTPIAILVRNSSNYSGDYDPLNRVYRPGHGDWTWAAKYGIRDHRGGGRDSERETIGRVAAGGVAKAFLEHLGISIHAWTASIAGIDAATPGDVDFDADEIDKNELRTPDAKAAFRMALRLDELRAEGDSAGCIVACRARGLPPGLGAPVFDKLDALIAQAMLSIGTAKGVEFGAGFRTATQRGSENNDPIFPAARGTDDQDSAKKEGSDYRDGGDIPAVRFGKNDAGGVLGGLSTGEDFFFRVAFKPVPSITLPQLSIDRNGMPKELIIGGKNDVCVTPRVIPIVEAMAALVIADLVLRSRADRCYRKRQSR